MVLISIRLAELLKRRFRDGRDILPTFFFLLSWNFNSPGFHNPSKSLSLRLNKKCILSVLLINSDFPRNAAAILFSASHKTETPLTQKMRVEVIHQ